MFILFPNLWTLTPIDLKNLTARSQERILRDSAYPEYNTIPPKIPDNFWGLRPPR